MTYFNRLNCRELSLKKKMQMKYILILFLFTLCSFAHGQGTYTADLKKLEFDLRAVMAKAERAKLMDKETKDALRDVSIELLERMIEASSQSNKIHNELLKSGLPPDKDLLLVTSAADSMILALNLTYRYMDVQDKLLWAQALAAARISKALMSEIIK